MFQPHSSTALFADRVDAGRRLAEALEPCRHQDAVVYALPRGGVIVAAEIARSLEAPLDLVITRKIGHPLSPECAIAAVGEDGNVFSNQEEMESVDRRWFVEQVGIQQREARRRRELYMQGRQPEDTSHKIAIIVDDGLATGLSMFAAVEVIRLRGPRRVVVAIPVAPPDAVRRIRRLVDDVVVLYTPQDFRAIGSYYSSFDQISDAEVIQALRTEGQR